MTCGLWPYRTAPLSTASPLSFGTMTLMSGMSERSPPRTSSHSAYPPTVRIVLIFGFCDVIPVTTLTIALIDSVNKSRMISWSKTSLSRLCLICPLNLEDLFFPLCFRPLILNSLLTPQGFALRFYHHRLSECFFSWFRILGEFQDNHPYRNPLMCWVLTRPLFPPGVADTFHPHMFHREPHLLQRVSLSDNHLPFSREQWNL